MKKKNKKKQQEINTTHWSLCTQRYSLWFLLQWQ